ncbi:M4 family metallopeptidase [Tellurirhabdus rosea]|uniref:M4 family metallopeptidase n=1 Tax=Tellurirhabdus rosea TaxID=2674997 RepID=UPI00224E2B3F|nr:M4 family metallopeptidase [Tellurirhabdus rosea]
MKAILSTLLLSVAVGAMAQPGPGFGRKMKNASATPGLVQRLKAEETPMPVLPAVPSRNGLLATTTSLQRQPLRLRVVRDTSSNRPVYIENRTPAKPSARAARRSLNATVFDFIGQVKALLSVTNPEQELTISKTETDALGQTHVRLAQRYQGVPVYGSELIAHVENGEVKLLNGSFRVIKNAVVTPSLSLTEASGRALQDVRKESIVRTFGDNILKMKAAEGELCLYPVADETVLAYRLTVRPNLIERWEYVVDAQTGAVLDKINTTCGVDGPVKATGKDLNGVSQTFQTYLIGSTYFLIDGSKSMFDKTASKLPNNGVGALLTLDAGNTYGDNWKVKHNISTSNTNWSATAISAHTNASKAYDYYQSVHKRTSLNGKGGNMLSIINIVEDDGKGMDNAFWNGEYMGYGNGNLYCKPLAGGLDVAGHEMTHGVVEHSANLEYKGQSGALNESFADVFGMMIDRDDWTLGEDVVLKTKYTSGAMRSFANPNQNGKGTLGYQPKHMSEFVETEKDNGGVHANSGIPNHAFYKIATAIGRDKAEKIYYRALTTYLTRTSKFLDCRLAVVRSAGDLFGAGSPEVTAAKQAFDAVGILETTETPEEPAKDLPTNNGQDMILLYGGDAKLYTVEFGKDKFDAKVKAMLKHKPSVTDDGKFAYYVSDDKKIRAINLTGTPQESIISDEAIWDNVAISRDGTKLAALTDEKDKAIWVYSYELKKWKKFGLFNPTSAEGVKTGEVEYADSFEWDPSGEYIIYDAYNKLKSLDGAAIDYWDVGFLRAWDTAKKTFGQGEIEKLFSNLEEGESVGNPSFSKNSPNIITFDYYNATDESYFILAADLREGKLTSVYENNTLGFPGYSRLDDRLIFNTLGEEDRPDVAVVRLKTDKITPDTDAETVYNNASWAVWYSTGTRTQPAKKTQTITFAELKDRYLSSDPVTLTATASSGLPVSFSVVSGPATISGNKLTMKGGGKVVVRATQAGNEQYQAATPVERSFNVQVVTGLEPTWQEAVRVYPNPVVSTLTVEVPAGANVLGISVVSAGGATVSRAAAGQTTLDLSGLTPGTYLLTIQTEKGREVRKIVKR